MLDVRVYFVLLRKLKIFRLGEDEEREKEEKGREEWGVQFKLLGWNSLLKQKLTELRRNVHQKKMKRGKKKAMEIFIYCVSFASCKR